MLVHFHVAHGAILALRTAFKATIAMAKQRQFIKACTTVAQAASQEKYVQADEITVDCWIADSRLYFIRQSRSERLICIQQQNPLVSQRQHVECPLPFLRPSTAVIKLDYSRSAGSRNLHRV